MIITRYLTKEIFFTLLATTVLLLLIFVSDQVLSYMRAAAGGHLSVKAVLLLLALQTPVLLSLLLPLSLYLSILLGFGRLYADSEITVLAACGVSRARLLRIALRFAFIIMLLVALLTLYIAPKMEVYSARLFAANESEALSLLMPGQFNSIAEGKWVFYVEDASKDNKQLTNVFAAQKPPANPSQNKQQSWGVVFAQGGHQKTDAQGNKFLVLTNGSRYAGTPGQRDYQIVNFQEYGVRINNIAKAPRSDENMLTTSYLWKNQQNPLLAAELNWRLALPIGVLVLTLLAVPLSRVKPRYGRYATLVPAILFYIIYANLMFLGRAWLSKGLLPVSLGMWWVHLVMLGIALLLICQQMGWWRLAHVFRRVNANG